MVSVYINEMAETMLHKVDFQKRIHEFDFIKGLAVLYMICNHILFDFGIAFYPSFAGTALEGFSSLCRTIHRSDASRYLTICLCSGVFISVSGALSTLSKKRIKEGLFLAVVSLAITAVSLAASKILNTSLTIWFGILHLLAVCMLLSPLLNKIPVAVLPFLAVGAYALGLYFRTVVAPTPFLTVFNMKSPGFYSADYYPVLPYVGFYLFGIFCGKCFYREKRSRLPLLGKKVFLPVRFLGGYSFAVYVLHQPVVYAIVWLLSVLVR